MKIYKRKFLNKSELSIGILEADINNKNGRGCVTLSLMLEGRTIHFYISSVDSEDKYRQSTIETIHSMIEILQDTLDAVEKSEEINFEYHKNENK